MKTIKETPALMGVVRAPSLGEETVGKETAGKKTAAEETAAEETAGRKASPRKPSARKPLARKLKRRFHPFRTEHTKRADRKAATITERLRLLRGPCFWRSDHSQRIAWRLARAQAKRQAE